MATNENENEDNDLIDVDEEEVVEDTIDEEVDKEVKPDDELDRTRKALAKANEEAKKNRLRVRELERAGEGDSEKVVREAAEQAEAKFKPMLVRSAARAAFAEAGLLSESTRVLKMIDMESVSVDEDGDIVGLDDQVADIKRDFPELFKRSRAPRDPDAPDKEPVRKPKSAADRLADQLLGR